MPTKTPRVELKQKEAILRISIVLLALAVAALLLFTLNPPSPAAVTELSGIEVSDYKGEKLGSVSDFRENSIKGPQNVDEASYRLEVTGLVESPKSYTYSEAIDFPKYSKVVTLYCVEGWDVTILWEGVLLSDIISASKAKPGANTVIFHAYDGYTTSLPLDYITNNNILLAYKMNNVTIPPERGFPFMVVAEDKWGYKWAKWVTGIELSNDPSYQGYWESRGYNNNGGLNGPIFG